ncbi:MAG TPA: hypothetical protein VH475_10770 [Tepidisphaeraceae bacterium]|jgi:hypothetical protein
MTTTSRVARGGWTLILFVVAVGAPGANAAITATYSNNMETGVGGEWSNGHIDATPRDQRRFLGPFTTDKVWLRLDKLPKHKWVRISCELFVISTWDGNGNTTPKRSTHPIGPDAWRMGVEDGPTLVDATFSNNDFETAQATAESRTQSYPSVLSGESYPAKTGAAERNTLGYQWVFDRVSRGVDSVYRLNFCIPNDRDAVGFWFAGGENLQPSDDECWGLKNVKVELLDDADLKKLDNEQMRRLWEAIGGRDVVAESDAFWALVTGGDDTARFLREKVKHPAGLDRERFAQLLSKLDGDDFDAREQATEAIKGLGPGARTMIREAIDHTDSAEVKLRLQTALNGLAQVAPADPQARRSAIALRLLEAIGTPEARKVIDELSGR